MSTAVALSGANSCLGPGFQGDGRQSTVSVVDAIDRLAEDRELRVDLRNRRRRVALCRDFNQLRGEAIVGDAEDVAFPVVALFAPTPESCASASRIWLSRGCPNLRSGVGASCANVVRPMYSGSEMTMPDGYLRRKYRRNQLTTCSCAASDWKEDGDICGERRQIMRSRFRLRRCYLAVATPRSW
jgi:hypothetical protein